MIYNKPTAKHHRWISICLFFIIVWTLFTMEFASRGFPSILNTPPTYLYKIGFFGDSKIRHGDLLYTFQPAVVPTFSGYLLNFKLTATNLGNTTAEFYYGDNAPLVYVYGLGGVRVSTFYEHLVSKAILYRVSLTPGESHSVNWTWSYDSAAFPPFLPGVYWVSASIYTGEGYFIGNTRHSIYVETSQILMLASF